MSLDLDMFRCFLPVTSGRRSSSVVLGHARPPGLG
jgi:hypothetical protein